MLISSIIAMLVLAAGVAVISMIVTIGVHDALARFHKNVLSLDTVFSHLIGARTEEERIKHGHTSFFLVAWITVIAFFVLWQMQSFRAITSESAAMAAGVFGLGLYLALMLVFLPVFRLGAFGRGHHQLVPYWGALFVAVFVAIASILVGIVI
jgi:hypothetical protein